MKLTNEWLHQPQTKYLAENLRLQVTELKEDAVTKAGLTVEQVAIRTIEICAEVRILEGLIEILTKEEEADE